MTLRIYNDNTITTRVREIFHQTEPWQKQKQLVVVRRRPSCVNMFTYLTSWKLQALGLLLFVLNWSIPRINKGNINRKLMTIQPSEPNGWGQISKKKRRLIFKNHLLFSSIIHVGEKDSMHDDHEALYFNCGHRFRP